MSPKFSSNFMQKKKLWIYLPLMILSSLFLFQKFRTPHPTSLGVEVDSGKVLHFYYQSQPLQPPMDPDEADLIRNAIVHEQLVGTLIKEKHGNTGRTEPYLAERWETSTNGRIWDFYLRAELTAEDGTRIDAQSMATSLKRRFRASARQHDLPAFNLLIGWKDFLKVPTAELAGLKVVTPLHLRMEFSAAPQGLLEYLAMSTYGFYADSNYRNESWATPLSIVSSGPYRLLQNREGGVVELKLRTDWPLFPKSAPDRILYRYAPIDVSLKSAPEHSIALVPNWDHQVDTKDFNIVPGAQIMLGFVILSPHPESLFQDLGNRNLFRAQLAEVQARTPFPGTGASFDNQFYPAAPSQSQPAKIPDSLSKRLLLDKWGAKKKVRIHAQVTGNSPAYEHLLGQVKEALRSNDLPYEIIGADHSDPKWMQKRNDPATHDIRIGTVDIGGNLENWVIKMMFCSKIGVGFPDPSGDICSLASKVENDPAALAEAAYAAEFNRILQKDSSVLPMYHFGYTWLVGKGVDLSPISPNMLVPRLEHFVLK